MPASKKQILPYLALAYGVLSLSFSGLFVRWSQAPGPVTSFYRMTTATLLMLPVILVHLRRQGMPRLRGGVGDLVVHLAVQVPRKLSKRQRELLRELGESYGEKPQTPTRVQRIREWFGA
jgi:hypothetical protein